MIENEVPQRQPTQDEIWYAKRMERYARQTRTAAVFIAWVLAIGMAVGVIVGIVVAVQLAKVGASPDCLTQGGINLSC